MSPPCPHGVLQGRVTDDVQIWTALWRLLTGRRMRDVQESPRDTCWKGRKAGRAGGIRYSRFTSVGNFYEQNRGLDGAAWQCTSQFWGW